MDPGRDGVAIGADGIQRCWWCVGDPLYERYHDQEWGRPVADDTRIPARSTRFFEPTGCPVATYSSTTRIRICRWR